MKQCLGRTRTFKRCKCKVSGKYAFFCRHHRWQPYAALMSVFSFFALFAGLYQDLLVPIRERFFEDHVVIEGIVQLNEVGGTPLSDVEISFLPSSATVRTTDSGFKIEVFGVNPGDSILMNVSYPGYEVVNRHSLNFIVPRKNTKPIQLIMCKKNERDYWVNIFYQLRLFKPSQDYFFPILHKKEGQTSNQFISKSNMTSSLADVLRVLSRKTTSADMVKKSFFYFENNEIEKAVNILDDNDIAIGISGKQIPERKWIDAILMKSLLLVAQMDLAGAERQLLKAVAYDEEYFYSQKTLAYFYLSTGRADPILQFEKTLFLSPDVIESIDLLRTLGRLHEGKNDLAKAGEFYLRAYETSKSVSNVEASNLAGRLIIIDEIFKYIPPDSAASIFKFISVDILIGIGTTYANQDQIDMSDIFYDRAYSDYHNFRAEKSAPFYNLLHTRISSVLYWQGLNYLQKKEFDRAEKYFQKTFTMYMEYCKEDDFEKLMDTYNRLLFLHKEKNEWQYCLEISNEMFSFFSTASEKDLSLNEYLTNILNETGLIAIHLDNVELAMQSFHRSREFGVDETLKGQKAYLAYISLSKYLLAMTKKYDDDNKDIEDALKISLDGFSLLAEREPCTYAVHKHRVLHELLTVYVRQDDFTKLDELNSDFLKFISSIESSCSDYNPYDLAGAYKVIGSCYFYIKKYVEAEKSFSDSFRVLNSIEEKKKNHEVILMDLLKIYNELKIVMNKNQK